MVLRKLLTVLTLVIAFQLSAQGKKIQLKEIWNGTFSEEGLESFNSYASDDLFSMLEYNSSYTSSKINVYNFGTNKFIETLLDSNDFNELGYISDYTFNSNKSKILITTEEKSIYRRSFYAKFYVYDLKSKTLNLVSDKAVQEATFSPDATKVAYVYGNNIFYKDLDSGETTQVTFDGKKEHIINGITDWVYEEEFAFVRAFEWNAKGDKIAYIKFDESEVMKFSMDIYSKGLYPFSYPFKYPKAGEKNSKVSLHVFDLNEKEELDFRISKSYKDFYIPRIKWTNDANILSAQFLNRGQNDLDLWVINVEKGTAKIILNEKDKAYIDIHDNLTFLNDNSFIWTSEKDGYNHIYHYNSDGDLINQVTKGEWEVTKFYGYKPKTKNLFYQSTEEGSVNRTISCVKLNGKSKKKLSGRVGYNSAVFYNNYNCYVNQYANVNTPTSYKLKFIGNSKKDRVLEDNKELKNTLENYSLPSKELSTIDINGNSLNYWIVKPTDFDENKKYPLLLYQYSGPGSQSVENIWLDSNDFWYKLLADMGYIVACVDGRGTGFKGADFKKVTQNQLGKYELEDQVAFAKKMGEKSFIDESRIGIWGWSFGGFMSSNAILKASDVFKTAIAVAPVTNWRFYDTVYTERYMSTPQLNPTGYDNNSPLGFGKNLKGKYLLIHGSADDNVHVQNTMRLIKELVQENKDFDWSIYPDKNHGIYGGNTRLHLYSKMTKFIKENL